METPELRARYELALIREAEAQGLVAAAEQAANIAYKRLYDAREERARAKKLIIGDNKPRPHRITLP